MLAKTARLNRQHFAGVFKTAKRRHSPYATLLYSPATNLRAAVVVSKKVSRQAVVRNRWRRRTYAHLALLNRQTALPFEYIVILKPAVLTLTPNEWRQHLETLIVGGPLIR